MPKDSIVTKLPFGARGPVIMPHFVDVHVYWLRNCQLLASTYYCQTVNVMKLIKPLLRIRTVEIVYRTTCVHRH